MFIIVDGRANSYDDAGSYTLQVSECVPNCANKVCGNDGCGGTCGGCAQFESCSGGQCSTTAGYSCDVPRNVGGLPYKHESNSNAFDTLYANTCGSTTSGDASPNVAYAFSPAQPGPYTAWVSAAWSGQVYAVKDCADIAGSCVSGPGASSIDFDVADGETVYLIVDGAPAGSAAGGSYTFRVDHTCFPDCTDKSCGGDGCGGSCGACAAPTDVCTPAQSCTDPSQIEGNACGAAFVVGALPFTAQGDTTEALNHYAVGDGQCPGFSEKGRGSNDHAWSFTAPTSGDFRFDVFTDDWDAALYLAADCDALAETCVAAGDSHYPWPDYLVATLGAGETVYLVIDGADNVFNDAGAYTLAVTEAL